MAKNEANIDQNEELMAEYNPSSFSITPIDKEIIIKAINKDEKSFENIFMGTYRYVFATVRRYLKNDQDLYDAIQDTYTRVYKGISRLENADSFYPWLHKIAENCAKDILSVNSGKATLPLDEENDALQEDKSGKLDVSADVTEVLKQLPPEQKELLIRVYYDKMRIAEIARMQNIPVTTLHNRLKSAKKNLKELLKIRGIDKPIYGGEFVSVLSSAIRNAIGTQLLSMAVAEEILHSVINSQNQKGAFVVSAMARSIRNKAALKISSLLLACCAVITAVVVLIVTLGNKTYIYITEEVIAKNEATSLNTSLSSQIKENGQNVGVSSKEESALSSVISSNKTQATSSYDFYFSTMTEKVTLKGAFSNNEVFGTHTENEELDIAVSNDTIYAVVKENLISLNAGSTSATVLIKNFKELYGEDGFCLNVYNNKVYWVNKNSSNKFVLNRCNINGTEHIAVVFSEFDCTYITKMVVAKDGVYFCAGIHGIYSYRKSGTLYKTDYNFNIQNKHENVADYTLMNDKVYFIFGNGNRGDPYYMDRSSFENPVNITVDHLPYDSIYALGEYVVLDSHSPYSHIENNVGTDLKIIDTVSGEIVRAVFGEAGMIVDIKDVSELDGGTILFRYNDKSMIMKLKTGETAVVENHIGTVAKSYKYYIENNNLYQSNIYGKSIKKIY